MLDIAVFGSGMGTNLQALIEHNEEKLYSISLAFADKECPFLTIAEKHHIPTLCLPYAGFTNRHAYDQEIVRLLRSYSIDLIVLAGYMKIITAPLLNAYPDRIITVHPADLKAVDQEGRRKYIGSDSIRMALEAGEKRTRSTVICINEKVDDGPILSLGPWVEYKGQYPPSDEDVDSHQEKQKRESDWPALVFAVKSLAKKDMPTCVECSEL